MLALVIAGSFFNQCGRLKNEWVGGGSVVKIPALQAQGPVSAEMWGRHGSRSVIPVSKSGGLEGGLSNLASGTSRISELWVPLRAPATVNKRNER